MWDKEFEAVAQREFFNGLQLFLECARDIGSPNDAFDVWRRAEPGEYEHAVKDSVGHTGYWYNQGTGYTPESLSQERHFQQFDDPYQAAYASLQRDLHHHLHGDLYVLRACVALSGYTLAHDRIGFDYSAWDALEDEYLEDRAYEVARENFSWKQLISQARHHAEDIAEKFMRVS